MREGQQKKLSRLRQGADRDTSVSPATEALILNFFETEVEPGLNDSLDAALASGSGLDVWHCYREILASRLARLQVEALVPRLPLGWDSSRLCAREAELVSDFVAFCQHALSVNLRHADVDPLDWIQTYVSLKSFLPTNQGRFRTPENPSAALFLEGEMPFLFGLLYSEFRAFRPWVARGRSYIRESLDFLPDSQGFLPGPLYSLARPLLASWARALGVAQAAGVPLLTSGLKKKYEWVLLQVMRWSRVNGQEVFSPCIASPTPRETTNFLALLELALPYDRDVHDQTAASHALTHLLPKSRGRRRNADSTDFPWLAALPCDGVVTMPGSCSDDSGLAAIRSGWRPKGTSLFLRTESETQPASGKQIPRNSLAMTMELTHNEVILWTGVCETSVRVAGRKLSPQSDWTLLCEEIEDKSTYLEWGLDLSDAWRLERSCLIVPDEQILLLTDVILSSASDSDAPAVPIVSEIHFPWTAAPLRRANEVALDASLIELPEELRTMSRGARELFLFHTPNDRKRKILPSARFVPLGLSEWFEDKSGGELTAGEDKLTLKTKSVGRNLCVPLLFDWDENRAKRACTWQRLTVGEKLTSVEPDIASAFRYQAGRDQYVFYRSLAGVTNRSFLGHHSGCELLFAKFDREENVVPLVTIDPGENS
ncbi:MAG: hypothetical protein Q4G68_07105 [Planctomycetia bacterium]|nr:hypothetical protein [Planctomycetia bacterium]